MFPAVIILFLCAAVAMICVILLIRFSFKKVEPYPIIVGNLSCFENKDANRLLRRILEQHDGAILYLGLNFDYLYEHKLGRRHFCPSLNAGEISLPIDPGGAENEYAGRYMLAIQADDDPALASDTYTGYGSGIYLRHVTGFFAVAKSEVTCGDTHVTQFSLSAATPDAEKMNDAPRLAAQMRSNIHRRDAAFLIKR